MHNHKHVSSSEACLPRPALEHVMLLERNYMTNTTLFATRVQMLVVGVLHKERSEHSMSVSLDMVQVQCSCGVQEFPKRKLNTQTCGNSYKHINSNEACIHPLASNMIACTQVAAAGLVLVRAGPGCFSFLFFQTLLQSTYLGTMKLQEQAPLQLERTAVIGWNFAVHAKQ